MTFSRSSINDWTNAKDSGARPKAGPEHIPRFDASCRGTGGTEGNAFQPIHNPTADHASSRSAVSERKHPYPSHVSVHISILRAMVTLTDDWCVAQIPFRVAMGAAVRPNDDADQERIEKYIQAQIAIMSTVLGNLGPAPESMERRQRAER